MIVTGGGKDTFTINSRVLTDFPDGDPISITFPNELVSMKIGKGGNAMMALNETGRECDVSLRILKGSGDDKFLQSLLDAMKLDFATFNLLTSEFIKRLGDGEGNITRDIYTMSGGIVTKFIETKESVEGDTEQFISVYTLKYSKAIRALM